MGGKKEPEKVRAKDHHVRTFVSAIGEEDRSIISILLS